jgi:hypothetical protein
MIASGETRPEGLMGAPQTADEGGQIQPELDPSGGCGGHAEVKIEAWKRATKDLTANHLLSDDRGSKDNSEVAESHDLIVRPKKKGKFSQKLANRETGERHVPPAVQASVDCMGDVGRGNDGEENNLVPLSLNSDPENLASLSVGSDTGYLAETYFIVDSEEKQNGSLALDSLL